MDLTFIEDRVVLRAVFLTMVKAFAGSPDELDGKISGFTDEHPKVFAADINPLSQETSVVPFDMLKARISLSPECNVEQRFSISNAL